LAVISTVFAGSDDWSSSSIAVNTQVGGIVMSILQSPSDNKDSKVASARLERNGKRTVMMVNNGASHS
jgi:fructose-1,6-bisphosphatase